MPKIRNIIIFIVIAAAFILIYIFFIKPSSQEANLVTSTPSASLPDMNNSPLSSDTGNTSDTSLVARDFLALLLNVKNIKLNDAIFSDPTFGSLRDSSIVLVPDGTEGRPNPFAQFGNDNIPINNNPSQPPVPNPNPAKP